MEKYDFFLIKSLPYKGYNYTYSIRKVKNSADFRVEFFKTQE